MARRSHHYGSLGGGGGGQGSPAQGSGPQSGEPSSEEARAPALPRAGWASPGGAPASLGIRRQRDGPLPPPPEN